MSPFLNRISEGLRSDWSGLRARLNGENFRRYRKWLLVPPALFLVWLFALYISIVSGFTSPDQVVLGAKGIEILDRNGQLLFTFSDDPGSSKITPLGEISPHLINATIAAEDANFWNNPGVNPKGLLRAAYENLAFWEYGGFFKGSGGSSLTQQLAKNLYIKPEERTQRSPIRKIKETILAFELNRRYSKEQILEWYLSDIYYGHGAYGVESASYRYFNKAPKDLTLAEATLIAGIPRAPAFYDPIVDLEAAQRRQQQVVNLMVRHGFIEQAEADAVLAEPVALREGRSPNTAAAGNTMAAHFAVYVREILPDLIGKTNMEGNLRVTTTLDANLQSKAESILATNVSRLEGQVGATNGALVAIDPKTGEILAMVGSPDFFRDEISGQVNNATSLNQPGSTIKAVTYLSAFMKGWNPATIIDDAPLRVVDGDSSYVLGNADKRYRGPVTARVALGSSLNVPAVKTLEYAGLPQVHALARKMGLTTLRGLENYGPAFTLGSAEATVLDMTYIYSVLANQGEQAGMSSVLGLPAGNRPLDPISVLKVERVDGKLIWEVKGKKERIVPANAAYLVTNVLSDDNARVSMFGANSPLNLLGRTAAAKSGSSDDSRDAWTIGYTPQLVTGVWVGNANNKPMPGATSTFTAAPIWQSFMLAALQGQPNVPFPVPEGIDVIKVCATTGGPPTPDCPNVIDEVFIAGRAPRVQATPDNKKKDDEKPKEATPANTPTPRSAGTPVPSPTPRPASPTNTPRPQNTPGRPATPTPRPDNTQAPTNTPRPTNTPNSGPSGSSTPGP